MRHKPPSHIPARSTAQLLARSLTHSFTHAPCGCGAVRSVLSCNKIDKLPHWIGDLVGLKELWLQDNPVTVLPRHLEQCHQLRRLTVDQPLQKSAKQVLMLCKNHREVEYFQKYGVEMPKEVSIDSPGRGGDEDDEDGAAGGGNTSVIGKVTQVCVVQ